MYFSFKKPPEPPPKKFYQQPALILTMVGMFVLGPIGYLWNGMAEELKKKVDNETLKLMIQKDRDALKRHETKNREQEQAIVENQKAIQVLLREQAVMKATKKADTPTPPKRVVVTGPTATMNTKETHQTAKTLSFKDFKEYKNASKEDQEAFRETRPEIDWRRYSRWTK